jgi:release factor glutamine methyltransferase
LAADLLNFVTPQAKTLDIIAANLPYIPAANLMLIDPLVRDFEPKMALDGGQDGFELYRRLFTQIRDNKFYPKILMIEIDDTQAEIAPLEAKKYFPEAKIELKKDLNKIERFLKITFQTE